MSWTVQDVRERIAAGKITRRSFIEHALERANEPGGTGHFVFTKIYNEQARMLSQMQDKDPGLAGGDLSGVSVSIKDLFDIADEVTTAGSTVLRNSQPAKKDAPAVARLRDAGAILVGRTNMTEFAYSGVGMNPHYGNPPNPYDRARGRISGGSTSGGAVSVSDGMAVAALGSDTGGSVRIPAALCGLTGFKPTRTRIPTQGMFPLSRTLDSVGVIAPTVNCCHAVNAALRQERYRPLEGKLLAGTTFVVAHEYFMDGVDASVSAAFERALSAISQAGARFETMEIPELYGMREINSSGGLAAAESFAFHRQLHLDMGQYDSRVRERILRGNDITDARYFEMLRLRHGLIASFAAHNLYDGLICPTVPVIAPLIRDMEEVSEFHRVNPLLLRNPSFANFFELCSVSLPCHQPGDAPVGLMLTGRAGYDEQLLSTALALEKVLGAQPQREFVLDHPLGS